jgi:hypothetical protein
MIAPPLPKKLKAAFARTDELPLPELAQLIGLHRNTLYRYCRNGLLRGRASGLGPHKRRRLFSRAEVEALWKKLHEQ